MPVSIANEGVEQYISRTEYRILHEDLRNLQPLDCRNLKLASYDFRKGLIAVKQADASRKDTVAVPRTSPNWQVQLARAEREGPQLSLRLVFPPNARQFRVWGV